MSVSLFHERLIIMAKSNKSLNLSFAEREIIQRGIENGSTKTSVAAILRKAKSITSNKIRPIETGIWLCSQLYY